RMGAPKGVNVVGSHRILPRCIDIGTWVRQSSIIPFKADPGRLVISVGEGSKVVRLGSHEFLTRKISVGGSIGYLAVRNLTPLIHYTANALSRGRCSRIASQ